MAKDGKLICLVVAAAIGNGTLVYCSRGSQSTFSGPQLLDTGCPKKVRHRGETVIRKIGQDKRLLSVCYCLNSHCLLLPGLLVSLIRLLFSSVSAVFHVLILHFCPHLQISVVLHQDSRGREATLLAVVGQDSNVLHDSSLTLWLYDAEQENFIQVEVSVPPCPFLLI